MAASGALPLLLLPNFVCLLLLFPTNVAGDVTPNYDSYDSPATATDSATANGTESATATPSLGTTEEPAKPTEEPATPTAPAEPLPASGRLPGPVTDVRSLCPCDELSGLCDVNCCCDSDCGEELNLFTGCSVPRVSVFRRLCGHDVASYALGSSPGGYAELRSSIRRETDDGVLCVQTQNRVDGFSHPPPAVPTDSNFDWLLKAFGSFSFSRQGGHDDDGSGGGSSDSSDPQESSGYQFGDVMVTADERGQTGLLRLPAAGVSAGCVDASPAAFLREQSGRCSRRLRLRQDCSALAALRMDTYAGILLRAEKTEDAALVPVEVASVALQSLDGSRARLDVSGEENMRPRLTGANVCANVVLKVDYVIRYSPAGRIVNATVALLLGFVGDAHLPLEQEFGVAFVQEDLEEAPVPFSGNPGYVQGLPLLSGRATAEGMSRGANPRDTLSLLRHAEDQDCLRGRHRRWPVLFGVDAVTGCTLRLEEGANCSLVSRLVLDVLRGQNRPEYVAAFGNSPLDNPLDWVPISRTSVPEESQTCAIPLSLHLEIEWTKYGSLLNPQAQIVSVREVIHTNTSSLAPLTDGGGTASVTSSVGFIPVSAAARPGFRATPTINARLPFDFFFPYV